MTPLDLDALDKQHPDPGERTDGGPKHCTTCWKPWPCTTSTLIAVVRKQNETLTSAAGSLAFVAYEAAAKTVMDALDEVAALTDLGEPTP